MCLPTSSNTNPSVSLSSPWRDGLRKKKEEGEERNIHLLNTHTHTQKKSLNYWLRRKFVINVGSPTLERASETTERRRDPGGHMRNHRPHPLLQALEL